MSGYTLIEPFAGGFSVGLRAAGGPSLIPPCSWMGGKRRMASHILAAMGVPCERPARVVLADAGPWGWVWPLLLDPETSADVARVLRSWEGEDPQALWVRLAARPPFDDQAERAAQWLWLQARSASGIPIWHGSWRDGPAEWKSSTGGGNAGQKGDNTDAPSSVARRGWRSDDHGRGRDQPVSQAHGPRPSTIAGWQQPSGAGGLKAAGQSRPSHPRSSEGDEQLVWRASSAPGQAPQIIGQRDPAGKYSKHGGGIIHPATVADRIEAIAYAFRRVEVITHHGDGAELLNLDLDGPLYCFADPPYHLPTNCTGYGWDMAHEQVLELARGFESRGAVVAISEGAAVDDLDGWHALDLTAQGNGKPEWLTLSRMPVRVPAVQQVLLSPVERP